MEPSTFTEWQKHRIRVGLIAARLRDVKGGEMLPLLDLAIAIEENLPNNYADFNPKGGEKKDKFFTLKQERLRLFLAGEDLGDDKLAAARDYLFAEEILDRKDYEAADDTQEFLSTHRYLANLTDPAIEKIKSLGTRMVAKRNISDVRETVIFELHVDPSGHYSRVLETFIDDVSERHVSTAGRAKLKDKGIRRRSKRRGYLFAAMRGAPLHVFLRGENIADRVAYMEVNPELIAFGGLERGEGTVLVCTRNAPLPVSAEGHEEAEVDLNIYNFKTVPASATDEAEKNRAD